LTVCDVLANLSKHAGKVVGVVGRLSWNMTDGGWLSQNGCGPRVPRGDPNFPFAIQLICVGGTSPLPPSPDFHFDPAAFRRQLKRLRKSTPLEYYDDFTVPRPGEQSRAKGDVDGRLWPH
jgi:hypothetical protein